MSSHAPWYSNQHLCILQRSYSSSITQNEFCVLCPLWYETHFTGNHWSMECKSPYSMYCTLPSPICANAGSSALQLEANNIMCNLFYLGNLTFSHFLVLYILNFLYLQIFLFNCLWFLWFTSPFFHLELVSFWMFGLGVGLKSQGFEINPHSLELPQLQYISPVFWSLQSTLF